MRNILSLFDARRARLAELRQWFNEQAQEPSGHVAAVSVVITGDGMVNTSGCGVEPEHAAVILEELKGVVARLEAIATRQASPEPARKVHQCQVIPLRRSAEAPAACLLSA
jgi:hypothetical protein